MNEQHSHTHDAPTTSLATRHHDGDGTLGAPAGARLRRDRYGRWWWLAQRGDTLSTIAAAFNRRDGEELNLITFNNDTAGVRQSGRSWLPVPGRYVRVPSVWVSPDRGSVAGVTVAEQYPSRRHAVAALGALGGSMWDASSSGKVLGAIDCGSAGEPGDTLYNLCVKAGGTDSKGLCHGKPVFGWGSELISCEVATPADQGGGAQQPPPPDPGGEGTGGNTGGSNNTPTIIGIEPNGKGQFWGWAQQFSDGTIGPVNYCTGDADKYVSYYDVATGSCVVSTDLQDQSGTGGGTSTGGKTTPGGGGGQTPGKTNPGTSPTGGANPAPAGQTTGAKVMAFVKKPAVVVAVVAVGAVALAAKYGKKRRSSSS